MEQNFQTSFIPKKPMVEERVSVSRPINIFNVVGIFLIIAVAVASGGLYFYKGTLEKNITEMSSNLELAKNRFEPARISQLETLDKRLRASSEILNNHIAVSPVFEALEAITLPTVRFTNFSYELGQLPLNNVKINLNGVAQGYRAVALQSDLFAKNENLIDPVFSNLVLDDSGNVVFDLTFSVDPAFVNYKGALKAQTGI